MRARGSARRIFAKLLETWSKRMLSTEISGHQVMFGGKDGCDVVGDRTVTWEVTGTASRAIELRIGKNIYVTIARSALRRAVRNCRALYIS